MKYGLSFMCALALPVFAAIPLAHAANVDITGPGTVTTINNAGTLDYISLTGGENFGSITNASAGVLNGTSTPTLTLNCCSSTWTANIGVTDGTSTGSITNNGTISRTVTDARAAGIIVAGTATIGGSIVNNGHITLSSAVSQRVDGILVDTGVTVSGSVLNTGTIAITNTNANLHGIDIYGTVAGNLTNSGSITLTGTSGESTAYGVQIGADATLSGILTNSGSISTNTSGDAVQNRGTIGGFTNSGTINITSDSADNSDGFEARTGASSGAITNSGTMTITVNGGDALGIYNLGSATTITNSGHVTVAGGVGGSSGAIYNTGAVSSITNSGTLTVSGDTGAFGIHNDGSGVVSGNITNNGTLTVTGGDAMGAFGIQNDASSVVSGDIINNGTLTVNAGASAQAFGIYNEASARNLINTKTINATAGDTGSALGMENDTDGVLSGSMTNSGTITSLATTGSGSGYVFGMLNNGSVAGDMVNSGTISATNHGGASSQVHGMANYGALTGSIINNKAITVSAGDSSYAYGLYNNAAANGMANSGTVTVTMGNGNSAGVAIAFSNDSAGVLTGAMSNSGTVTVTGGTDGQTYGFLNMHNATSMTNTGTLSVTGGDGGAVASMLNNGGATLSGSMTNSGTMTTLLTAGAGSSFSYGMRNAGTVQGDMNNTGTMTATSQDGVSNLSAGISNVGAVTGSLLNSGKITVTAADAGDADGLYNDGSATSMTNSGTIIGTVGASGPQLIAMVNDNGGVLAGAITNSGSISLTGGTNSQVLALININTATDITNSGTITATGGNQSDLNGLANTGSLSGSMTNSGTITLHVTAGANAGYTIGMVNSGGLAGGITNSGTITLLNEDGAGSFNYGIYNNNAVPGGITNTGSITTLMANNTLGWGIYNTSNSSAVTINQNAGSITGNIAMSGQGDTLNINAGTVTGSITGNIVGGGSDDADTVNLNGGRLALLSDSTISAVGNYTQASGATLSVGATPASSATIHAANITLDGTLNVVPSGSGWVVNVAHTYTDFINASSALSGDFSTVTSASPLFTASVTADGSNARTLSVTEVSPNFSSAAVNDFISGVLGNTTSSAAQSLANGLESLNTSQLHSAVTQLTGTPLTQSIQALRSVSTGFSGMVQQRLISGTGYDSSDLFAFHMNGSNVQMAALDSDILTIPNIAPSVEGGAWMRGFGNFAGGASQGGMAGFNQTTGGVIFGLDKKMNEAWTLGTAFQYAHTSLGFNDNSAASDADSYNGLVYGGWHQDRVYVSGTAGFGWNQDHSSRSLAVGGFTANPSGSFAGQTYSASAETGYAFYAKDEAGGLWALTPYAGLDYTHTHTGAYTENGDGVTNLAVHASDNDSFITTLGTRFGTKVETKNYGLFLPEIHLGWQHEHLDETSTMQAAFVSSPGSAFSVAGSNYGRDSAIAGAGLTQQLSQRSRIFLTYDAKLNGGYTEHAVSGGFRFEF